MITFLPKTAPNIVGLKQLHFCALWREVTTLIHPGLLHTAVIFKRVSRTTRSKVTQQLVLAVGQVPGTPQSALHQSWFSKQRPSPDSTCKKFHIPARKNGKRSPGSVRPRCRSMPVEEEREKEGRAGRRSRLRVRVSRSFCSADGESQQTGLMSPKSRPAVCEQPGRHDL